MDRKWDYLQLVRICQLMKEENYPLSKISLQEILYILQEIYGVKSTYDFKLFTYGPYSIRLTEDLDMLLARRILSQEYCQGPVHYGFRLLPGENYKLAYFTNYQDILEGYEERLKRVVQLFGRHSARDLELRAALIFLSVRYGIKKEALVEKIQSIKGYFKREEVKEALLELAEIPEIREKIKE